MENFIFCEAVFPIKVFFQVKPRKDLDELFFVEGISYGEERESLVVYKHLLNLMQINLVQLTCMVCSIWNVSHMIFEHRFLLMSWIISARNGLMTRNSKLIYLS